MEKSIELQKKQNWIRVKILILNLSLAFNPQMWGIAGTSWTLTKSQSSKAKSIMQGRK